MHVLFEESGKFMVARVLAQAEASSQVELESGKRLKVKAANILLQIDQHEPGPFLTNARLLAADIDLEMAWEFAPEGEFGFADLAREYFCARCSLPEQAAMLMRLHEAPHYFRRAGKGRYRKASAEVVAQALAAMERKRVQTLQIEDWARALGEGQCPTPIAEQLYRILFKPDKNAPEYKAVVQAARATHSAPLALLQRAGAIQSPYHFHWKRFLLEYFPKGIGFPDAALATPALAELPLAAVQALSIDDSSTTEIDDALSVQGLGTGTVTIGIHIAAPALVIQPGDGLDQVGRTRLSTVYMPGHKITMLPETLVQACTLQQGRACPAVSLYVRLNETTLELLETESRIERVPIAHNLRHDQLDDTVTEAWLQGPAPTPGHDAVSALHPTLALLFRWAGTLKAQREVVRGKPETFNRPDYTFKLLAQPGAEPDGSETVHISTRRRGAPLDLIVAEAMILANSTWGAWLAELGVPAIYRSQASLAPGIKVRMSTRALPHAGIGVRCYAWSSSPLRRYVDLVNQWQIITCIRHGRAAALVAPFQPKDASLLAIISSFDDTYSAYNAYQAAMERFWTLRYLQQHGWSELEATLIKDNLARADTLPLVLPVLGAQAWPRGTRVRLRLSEPDLIGLDIHGTVLERLGNPANAEESPDNTDADDDTVAGPLAIALDVNEVTDAPISSEEASAP